MPTLDQPDFIQIIQKKKHTNRVATVYCKSPELILGETNYSTELDIWSLGCLLWELLTKEILFYGHTDGEVFIRICQILGTPKDSFWPELAASKKDYNRHLFPKTKYVNIFRDYAKKYTIIDNVTFDLITKMLCLNPKERIKLEDIFNHPFFISHEPQKCRQIDMPKFEEDFHYLKENVGKKEKKGKAQIIAESGYNKKALKFVGKKRDHS